MKGTYDRIPEREEETQEYLDTVFTGDHYTIYDIAFESNTKDGKTSIIFIEQPENVQTKQ